MVRPKKQPGRSGSRLDGRLRLLRVREILLQESDAENGITIRTIQQQLKNSGISAAYNTVRDDIRALRACGMDIETSQGKRSGYMVKTREFTDAEIRLVANAVQSCGFLTKAQRHELANKLAALASANVQDALIREVFVNMQNQAENDAIYDNVNAICEAIRRHQQIKFDYVHYGFDLKRHPDGKDDRIVTPIALTFTRGNYYALVWNPEKPDENDDCTRVYRVDRMGSVEMLETPAHNATAIPQTRDAIEEKLRSMLDMYSGKPVFVKMEAKQSCMDLIMERFDKDSVNVYGPKGGNDAFRPVHIKTVDNPVLAGWCAMLEYPDNPDARNIRVKERL